MIQRPLRLAIAARVSLVACMMMVLLGTGPQSAWAHERHYVFNQEYKTLPQGGMELESHTRFKMPDTHRSYQNSWTYQQELEYGVTDHLTLAHYEIWKTENDKGNEDSTRYRGFHFEGKYRIGEKGKYWVDPLLYVEWSTDPQEKGRENAIESKLVLSKDWRKFNLVYSQVMESQLGSGGRTEHTFTSGASYEIFDEARIGLEFTGDYWLPSKEPRGVALGPTVSYAFKYFWVVAGVGWGLNRAADDVEARLIVGIPLM